MATKNPGALLVVEDGDEDFDMLQLAFRRSGATNPLMRCTDGDEALDYLLHRGAFTEPQRAPRPAIILLDLNLAGTDGREVLREIRREEELRTIPIMVLSTSNNPRDVAFCYREGANCYAIKPVGLEKFERLIELFRQFWLENMELPPAPSGELSWP